MQARKVIYARKSDVKIDIENQISLMKDRWGHDIEVVQELASGRSKRPKLMKLISDLPSGSTIYVAHSDRLTRCGIRDVWKIDYLAEMRGITIESLHEGVLTKEMTPTEQAIRSMHALGAAMEAEAAGRRQRDMFARRKAQGLLSGVYLAIQNGRHRHAGKERMPEIVAAEPRIRELSSSGHSIRQIRSEINREFGHPISVAYIHRILHRYGPFPA